MRLKGTIWLREIVDKLAFKHGVEINEVEEVLTNNPKVRFVEKGERREKTFTSQPAKQMLEDTCLWYSSLSQLGKH